MTADADLAFVVDRLEDALDAGTVDHRAREELLAALAELEPERAEARRERMATAPRMSSRLES